MGKLVQDIEKLAETILQDIDYDIYKGDLEERNLLIGIENSLWFLAELIHKNGLGYLTDEDGETE